MIKPITRWLAGTCLLAAAAASSAAVQTLNSTAEGGFWSPLGYADQGGSLAGRVGRDELPFGPMGIGGLFTNRAYVMFDLSGQTQPITSAELRIKVTDYQSVAAGTAVVGTNPPSITWPTVGHASDTYGVFDVSTSPTDLTAAYGIPSGGSIGSVNSAGLAVWDDLGGGSQWGQFDASAASVGQFVDVPLSADAVAALNASLGGKVAFGLSFIGVPLPAGIGGQLGAPLTHQEIAIDTLDTGHELVITSVPEPDAAWLMLGGGVLLAVRGIRHKSD